MELRPIIVDIMILPPVGNNYAVPNSSWPFSSQLVVNSIDLSSYLHFTTFKLASSDAHFFVRFFSNSPHTRYQMRNLTISIKQNTLLICERSRSASSFI